MREGKSRGALVEVVVVALVIAAVGLDASGCSSSKASADAEAPACCPVGISTLACDYAPGGARPESGVCPHVYDQVPARFHIEKDESGCDHVVQVGTEFNGCSAPEVPDSGADTDAAVACCPLHLESLSSCTYSNGGTRPPSGFCGINYDQAPIAYEITKDENGCDVLVEMGGVHICNAFDARPPLPDASAGQ